MRRPRACRKRIIALLALALLPQTHTSHGLQQPRSCSTLIHRRRMPTGNLRCTTSRRFVTQSQVITAGTPVTRECLSNVHRSVRQGKAWQPPQYRILVSPQSQVELTNSPNVRTWISGDT